jgi:predicted ATPase
MGITLGCRRPRRPGCAIGRRRTRSLAGEPGIGKTRLASHAALRAHAEGFAVCWGACSEDVAAPYQPWIEVCSQLIEHAPDDVLAAYVASRGGEIGRLARGLARRVPDVPAPQSSDPETERFLLFKAVAELLLAVAGSRPLCVVLDDFHWADGQSVALLRHVTRAVEQGALMVIVVYRDSDLTKDHPLTGVLADLRRSEGVDRIPLSGLGPVEVAELVAAAAGHELDADGLALAGGLATETGGNPFFVGEILRNLIESGAITFDETAGRWSVDRAAMSSLPESVREVVEHRIDRLGEQPREALRIAAATFACEFHHRHGLRVWEARSELGWADALAERGERDRAREHASRALELSRDHGYGAFEPRAAVIVTSHTAIEP